MEKKKIVSLEGVLRKLHLKFLDDLSHPLKGQVTYHSRAGLEENPVGKEKESFIEEISRNSTWKISRCLCGELFFSLFAIGKKKGEGVRDQICQIEVIFFGST